MLCGSAAVVGGCRELRGDFLDVGLALVVQGEAVDDVRAVPGPVEVVVHDHGGGTVAQGLGDVGVVGGVREVEFAVGRA